MTSPGVATTTTALLPLAAIRAQVTCRGTTIRFFPFSLLWQSSLYIVGFEKQSRTLIIASDQLLQFCHVHPVSLKGKRSQRARVQLQAVQTDSFIPRKLPGRHLDRSILSAHLSYSYLRSLRTLE